MPSRPASAADAWYEHVGAAEPAVGDAGPRRDVSAKQAGFWIVGIDQGPARARTVPSRPAIEAPMHFPGSETMLAFTLASMLLVAVPGPSVSFVVTRSAERGVAAGMVTVLGLESAAAVHAGLAAAGVTAVLRLFPMAMQLVEWGGAGYLVWLAVRTLRQARLTPEHVPSSGSAGRGRLFLDGFLVDLLNPKTALFFLAFLPQFVDPDAGAPAEQTALLGLVFVVLAAACDSIYAVLAGTFSARLRGSCRARRRLAMVSGVVYLALAAVTVVL